jgi:hypothetical protein
MCSQLVDEYEAARSLLSAYDEEAKRRMSRLSGRYKPCRTKLLSRLSS